MVGRKASKDDTEVQDAKSAAEESQQEGHVTGERSGTTTVEGEMPGDPAINTAPGDAPADTTDPRERISTLIPSGAEAAEAAKAGLPVVAYVKTGMARLPFGPDPDRDVSEDRTERYEVQGVEIEHNLETGESKRV
jgi:hypothetical protein